MKIKLTKFSQWREECSVVTAFKMAYRGASKNQRQMMRAWMRRVLSNQDSTL